MLEAVHNTCKALKLGTVQKITEDYTVTDRGVWCHVLSQKRMLQIQAEENLPVNYLPHPCLFVNSSMRRAQPALCLVLHKKNKEICAQLTNICAFLASKGMQISKIDDMDLDPLKRIRAFKEASFVVAWDCSSWLSQISLCASGRPFLLAETEVCKITKNYLEIANLSEALWKKTDAGAGMVERVAEIYLNKKAFKELSSATIKEMKNLYTWKRHIHQSPRGDGLLVSRQWPFALDAACPHFNLLEHSYKAGVYLAFNLREIFLLKKEVILFPWVGYLHSENIEAVDSDAFKVSMICCQGIVAESQEVANKIEHSLKPIPVSVLPLPQKSFDLEAWKREQRARVFCPDGVSISTQLSTLRSKRVHAGIPIDEGIVVAQEALSWYEIRKHIVEGTPFVCPQAGELPGLLQGYPGFCNGQLDPQTVSKFLTVERVEKMEQMISQLQAKLFVQEFMQTAVYTNCMELYK